MMSRMLSDLRAVVRRFLSSMTRTMVNVAFRVEKRRGMFHGFLFDMFALAVVGLLAAAVSAASSPWSPSGLRCSAPPSRHRRSASARPAPWRCR